MAQWTWTHGTFEADFAPDPDGSATTAPAFAVAGLLTSMLTTFVVLFHSLLPLVGAAAGWVAAAMLLWRGAPLRVAVNAREIVVAKRFLGRLWGRRVVPIGRIASVSVETRAIPGIPDAEARSLVLTFVEGEPIEVPAPGVPEDQLRSLADAIREVKDRADDPPYAALSAAPGTPSVDPALDPLLVRAALRAHAPER